jgi:lysyl-tRNA synthetase class I
MKIALKDLADMEKALGKVMNTPMNFKLSYRLAKIAGKLTSEFKHINNTRQEIIKKYGKQDPKTKTFTVLDEKVEEAGKEFDDFLAQEITLEVDKIPTECIQDISISANDLASIAVLIEEPTTEPSKKAKK